MDAGEPAGLCCSCCFVLLWFGFGPAKVDILVRHPTEDTECVGVYMSFLVQS